MPITILTLSATTVRRAQQRIPCTNPAIPMLRYRSTGFWMMCQAGPARPQIAFWKSWENAQDAFSRSRKRRWWNLFSSPFPPPDHS